MHFPPEGLQPRQGSFAQNYNKGLELPDQHRMRAPHRQLDLLLLGRSPGAKWGRRQEFLNRVLLPRILSTGNSSLARYLSDRRNP